MRHLIALLLALPGVAAQAAPPAPTPIVAIRAGVRTIDHGTMMDEEAVELMKAHKTYYVPTLMTLDSIEVDPTVPAPEKARAKQMAAFAGKSFQMVLKSGVPIGFGTDAAISLLHHTLVLGNETRSAGL